MSAQRFQIVAEGHVPIALESGRTTIGPSGDVDVVVSGVGSGESDGPQLVFTVTPGRVYCQHATPGEAFTLNGASVRAGQVVAGDRIELGRTLRLEAIAPPSTDGRGSSAEIVHARDSQASLSEAYEQAASGGDVVRAGTLLSLFYRAAELVAHVADARELGKGLVDLVTSVLPARAACCLRFDADGEMSLLAQSEGAQMRPSTTVARRVFEQRVSLVTFDAATDPRLLGAKSLIAGEVVRVIACAPICYGDRVLGALYADCSESPRDPTTSDLMLLESIASFAGVAFSRADLYAALEQRELQTHLLVHDMKNPLGAVRSALDLLETGASDRAAQIIGAAHVRLDGFVNDILSVAQLEEGRLRVARVDVDAAALRLSIQGRWQSAAELTEVALAVDISQVVAPLRWDARLLERVIDNLLDNALRYAPRASTIAVNVACAQPDTWRVEVCDGGPGVPPERRETVMDKFERTESASGRGLGLYFCRLAVEAHGGSIHIEGEPGANRVVLQLGA